MTAQPSPEFRAHHDVAPPRVDRRAFRQGWQVHTRLAQLRDDGAIDEAAYQAAIRFRADWDAAFGRGRSAPLLALPGSGSMTEHDRMFRRLAVLDRLTAAAAHAGPFFAKLLQQCVVEDRTWAWIARTHGVSDKTARKWTVAALGRLATLETGTREPPGARYAARPDPDVSGSGQIEAPRSGRKTGLAAARNYCAQSGQGVAISLSGACYAARSASQSSQRHRIPRLGS